MLKSLGYSIRQGFRQIFRNRTMSIASCFSITAMLLILGIFFILLINVNMVAETVKGDYDTIEVFMLDKTEKEDTLAIMDELQTVDGVSSVTYRTKKEALESRKKTIQSNYKYYWDYEKDLKTVTLNVDEILGFYTERHPSKQQEELLP